jgi:hypothetical protein
MEDNVTYCRRRASEERTARVRGANMISIMCAKMRPKM